MITNFKGIVNGKEFHTKEAFDNYVKDLKEPITEYITETETYYSDDIEQIEAERNAGCNRCNNCDDHCKKEGPMRDLVVPKPYKSVVDYIVPTIDEIDNTADIIANEPERINRVESNLNERLDYFVNEVEFADDDVNTDGVMKNIVDAAKVTADYCTEMFKKTRKQVFDIEEEIAKLNRKLERMQTVRDFYENVAGYASAMADK